MQIATLQVKGQSLDLQRCKKSTIIASLDLMSLPIGQFLGQLLHKSSRLKIWVNFKIYLSDFLKIKKKFFDQKSIPQSGCSADWNCREAVCVIN